MAHLSMDEGDDLDEDFDDDASDSLASSAAEPGSEDQDPGAGRSEWGDEELPLEEFEVDTIEAADTTARQASEGRDLQGIPWNQLQVTREQYRAQRLARYRNYMNVIPEDECGAVRDQLTAGWPQPALLPPSASPYAFLRNWRAVASSIVHFQLRNLLWAASAHDVLVVYDNRVQHWSSVTRAVGDVLDLRGPPRGPRLPGLSRVQVSTMCVEGDLLAAGGFTGELVLARMSRAEHGPGWEQEEDDGDDTASSEAEAEAGDEQPTQQSGGHGPLGRGSTLPWQGFDAQQAHGQQQEQEQQEQEQQPQSDWWQAVCSWQRPLPPPRGDWQHHVLQQAQQQQEQQQRHQQQHAWARPHAQPGPSQAAPQWPGQQHAYLPLLQQRPRRPRARRQEPPQPQPQRNPLGEPLLGAAGPSAAEVLHCCRVTQSENGITNGIELFNSCNFGHCAMTANNDCCVRLFDIEGCRPRGRIAFPFAVNYATLRPAGAAPGGGALAAVVGDDPVTWLVDCRSGLEVMKLTGHRDYSFAAAWHPAGQLLATGNQDSTTRVWDVRAPGEPLAVLGGRMGAIRSLRFSPDGRHLAAAEPADFVHVYDAGGGFGSAQTIDLFGEVAGIAFSPDGAAFYVAISDTLYSSLLQWRRADAAGAPPPG